MKKLIPILCLSLLLFSCGKKEEEEVIEPETKIEVIEEVKPKDLEIKPVSFSDLKNWQNDDLIQAFQSIKDSCKAIRFEKNKFLSNSAIQIPTADYQKICKLLSEQTFKNSSEMRSFLEKHFTPYAVYEKGSEIGKFTSYYESALNASYTKSDKYKYPIYGRPKDLIEFNLKDFDNSLPNKRYVGRIEGTKLIPYYTRAEIERNHIKAPVLLWADSHVDIYVMQIQGSAVADLDDGTKVRIGYADNNGHNFKGIGSILLEKGLIKPGQASMGKIKQWLLENGDLAVSNMAENKRYVFHRLTNAEGPLGAQGVALRAGRSLAVDKHFVPLGSLLWLETTGPDREKIEKLVVAQDIGGAIKGAVRGDYFWGSGKDDILEKAGKMNSQGRYYILIPRVFND